MRIHLSLKLKRINLFIQAVKAAFLWDKRMNNYDLNEQAQVLAETHTPHQLAKKYLLAQEEASNIQDLIAFLDDMLPNLDELIEQYE